MLEQLKEYIEERIEESIKFEIQAIENFNFDSRRQEIAIQDTYDIVLMQIEKIRKERKGIK